MSVAVAEAIFDALSADATITGTHSAQVFKDQATQGAEYPFVVFTLITSPDAYTFGARVWSDDLWQIRAFDSGPSTARAEALMERVDEVLTDQPLVIGSTPALVVRRMERLPGLPETDDAGIVIQSAGARFQIGVAA